MCDPFMLVLGCMRRNRVWCAFLSRGVGDVVKLFSSSVNMQGIRRVAAMT